MDLLHVAAGRSYNIRRPLSSYTGFRFSRKLGECSLQVPVQEKSAVLDVDHWWCRKGTLQKKRKKAPKSVERRKKALFRHQLAGARHGKA
jgi:hypothetical protein